MCEIGISQSIDAPNNRMADGQAFGRASESSWRWLTSGIETPTIHNDVNVLFTPRRVLNSLLCVARHFPVVTSSRRGESSSVFLPPVLHDAVGFLFLPRLDVSG
jgi:hypothetical protein